MSLASPQGLPLWGWGGSEPHVGPWWCVGLSAGTRLPAATTDINPSLLPLLEEPQPVLHEDFPHVTLSLLCQSRVLEPMVGGESRGNGEGRHWGGPDVPLCSCREAIGLVCEAVPGAKGAVRRRKVSAAGGSCLGAAGCPQTGQTGALISRSSGAQLEWGRERDAHLCCGGQWEVPCSPPARLGARPRESLPHTAVRPQPCGRSLNSILGKSNLKFAGMPITLTISTSSLNLMASDCKQVRAGRRWALAVDEQDLSRPSAQVPLGQGMSPPP